MVATGTVKTYDAEKGIGYIIPDQGGPEVFVHYSSFMGDARQLTYGEKVEYQLTEGSHGPQAERVFVF